MVAGFLDRQLPPSSPIVVGLSGGVDSVVLLSLLRQLADRCGAGLSALHVHHGLSPHADRWAAFCQDLCDRWDIPLRIERVTVHRGDSLEAQARHARYAVFERLGGVALALAHHRGDQAETVLLNLLRGAGVRGAGAMPQTRRLAGGALVLRPLLGTSQGELLAWAREHALTWVDDESNHDVRHTRNFLRHSVLPVLAQRFPDCEQALARAAWRMREAESLLEALAEVDRGACAGPDGGVRVAALASLGAARAGNLLRQLLRVSGAPSVTGDWLDQALQQLLTAGDETTPEVHLGGWSLRRYRGVVYVVAPLARGGSAQRAWRGEPRLGWGDTLVCFEAAAGAGIDSALIAEGHWCLRPRAGSERLRMRIGGARRSLKNLLQEAGVPPWRRAHIPLLYHDGMLVWVPGVGVAIEYRCPEGRPGCVPRWEVGAAGK